jgi:hypothetical protein
MYHGKPAFMKVLVLSTMLGGAVAAGPVWAAGADAGSTLQPAAASGEQKAKAPHVDPVEARIHDLHEKLQITASQEGQWDGVAKTMRSNAKALETLVREKRKNEQDMTAIEDLRAYQEIAQAHARATAKLADAFEVLYQTMSDDQKKVADAVFRQHKADHTGKK